VSPASSRTKPDNTSPLTLLFCCQELPQRLSRRPADIILDKDGSILVTDDWAGAIYRSSYSQ
jgi:glucose/arabinose dehydrogenase